ncbi:TonB-dependent receptor [Foetidibacter luteolus]|uniref:TonB-dependent receptor n=1 Tax=Foetidibacter luteolus TaxID=2608880 RepID=UPI00129A533A|nr:TonB-dependent receptor [Foetidibacter luteolus]
MIRTVLFLWLVMGMCSAVNAQKKFTINGYVRDSASGETLIGANITVGGESRGVATNNFGFYSLTLDSGHYSLLCSFVGYQRRQIELALDKNTELNIDLTSYSSLINNVTVTASRRESNVKTAQMGKIELNINTVKALPAIFGETDILKTLQLMPGVRNAGEGNSGFYVRGGGPDQNLIMLDDAVVYNTGHLFGFFSVFNSDAIKSLSLIKGGMPAQYGGRLASVIDIAMKEGNLNKTEVDAGIGLIASRLSIQGPIKKQKSSFMISARRTYIDLLISPFITKSSSFHGSGYYFYDLNAKVNFKISEKDRLYISGYLGQDVFRYNNTKRSFSLKIPWGNSTATVRWNHVFNRKMFANLTAVYNDYKFDFTGSQNDFNIGLSSGIRDINAKVDFDYYPVPAHKLKFGGQTTFHTFLPSVASGSQDTTNFSPNNAVKKYANEIALYIQDDWEITHKLQLNAGLRYSRFIQVGKYTQYKKDADGNKLDSTFYGWGDVVKAYGGFEPRATLRYAINDESSVKLGITRNLQYIHLVTNAGTTLPTDIWVPSTVRVKPQIGWQYAAGYFRNFKNNMFETSLEVYYKDMGNQIEYREGYTQNISDVEEDFVFGKGWAYGAEIFVNKVKGRFTGWVGYTLSWTWRKFTQLNDGNKFPSKYDRRHDLSVVAMYQLSKKWKLSSIFVFGTGNATSLPERFYFVDGVLTQEFGKINAYRVQPYHRLDLSATYTPVQKKKRKYTGSWVFSLYNAYSRLNPYFYFYDQEGGATEGTLKVTPKKVALFPIIPSVTWNVKF